MRTLVLALALSAVAVSAVYHSGHKFEFDRHSKPYTFEQYQTDFNKKYERHAAQFHKKVFAANLAKIIAHNSDKSHTWKMAVNRFTDMSETQRRAFLGSDVMAAAERMGIERVPADLPAMDVNDLPASVDWRNVNPPIITAVKDQGQCGSCWAHGATESIESYVAMATGKLLTLSRQNLVDCAPNPNDCGGTGGCQGSTAELGFSYVSQSGGIATEAGYPYHAVNQQCNTSAKKAATVESWVVLQNNNYTQLVQAVATVGPLAINADASSWFDYSSGVFTGCSFDNIDINHVIQLVGYGTDSAGGDYWLVRNSWNTGWGESGYIRIQKHSDGSNQWCGPDTRPQDGVGCNGGPSTVTVCGSCGIWYDTSYPTGGSIVN